MVVISLLLAGGAFAIEKTQAPITTDTTVYVLEVKDTEIQRIDVTARAGTAAFERAEPFGWKFADSGDQADLSRVSSVVNRLAKLRSSSKVSDTVGDLSPYGLAPPVDTALLTLKDGTQHRVVIGNKTPNDAAYYAMVEGKPRLHTINTLLVGDIEKLVVDPPVPSPTPATATPAAQAAGTPTPPGSPAADGQEPPEGTPTPLPTIGLPGPSVGN
jgi:hypothetical protein